MNPKISILTRLLSETPPFWKKVQVISLALLAIAGELAKLQALPAAWYQLFTGALSAVALVAQFAINDTPAVLEAIDHPESLLIHLPEILDQVTQISDCLKKPVTPEEKTA